MSGYLWDKNDRGEGPDAVVQRFLSGDDVVLDRQLFVFDIRATRAHAHGLARIGVLSANEAAALDAALAELLTEFEAGRFVLEPPLEDGHSAIEAFLTERLGETGRKIHTGRSRNDQVQVALRLYLKDRLAALEDLCRGSAAAFLDRAEQGRELPMPGYTHLQRAVPSSIGLWLAGFAEAFIDNRDLARATHAWIDTCPLGTAAGYGVNLGLDRAAVAAELGFARLQVNPLYVQNSRGRFELQALCALAQCTLELRRFAWDLSLYATEQFGFVSLPGRYVTGSSIMPNKANPDAVELLRARHGLIQGALTELQAALSLPSGYHRDLQVTKEPVIRAFEGGLQALALLPELVRDFRWHPEAMRAAIDESMYATDVAIESALAGRAFRDAYREALAELEGQPRTPEQSLAARISPGGCADLRLEELRRRLEKPDI